MQNINAVHSASANWASRIRTVVCSSQSAVPYRLAMAHYYSNNSAHCGWLEGLEPSVSRTTIWRVNQLRYSHHIKMCPKGFEPPTHGLEGRCSIQLSYGHMLVADMSQMQTHQNPKT